MAQINILDPIQFTPQVFTAAEVAAIKAANNASGTNAFATLQDIQQAGGGDMLSSVYDPTNKQANVFSMGNMDETATAKILTQIERDQIAQAYLWGDHSLVGYLTSFNEVDPIYSASPAATIITDDITNWNAAFSWGDHSLVGYLTSFNEVDPIFVASPAYDLTQTLVDAIVAATTASGTNRFATMLDVGSAGGGDMTKAIYDPGNVSGNVFSMGNMVETATAKILTDVERTNWNTAYNWGNHASVGYLTSFNETDPVFGASAAAGITTQNITNWNASFGWGDHSLAGYLTSFTEVDPVFIASAAFNITAQHVTDLNNLGSISSWDIWEGTQAQYDALGTYDPTTLYFIDGSLLSADITAALEGAAAPSASNVFATIADITSSGGGDMLASVYDPTAIAASAFSMGNMIETTTAKILTDTERSNIATAFGWGDHSIVGYLTSYNETDPVFIASAAYGIATLDIINWNTAFGWGDHAGLYSLLNHNHLGVYEPANANIQTHISTTTGNPHSVSATDVGLGNVDNTSDVNKPVSTAQQAALDDKVDKGTTRTVTASFTVQATDAEGYLRSTAATAINATVEDTLPIGSVVTYRQAGAGIITLVAGAGVTLNGDGNSAGQHSTMQIKKVAAGVYDVIGGVA